MLCAFHHDAVTTVLGLEAGKECIVVGTLYKHMKLKPSILDEYSKEVCMAIYDGLLDLIFLFCIFFILASSSFLPILMLSSLAEVCSSSCKTS